MVSAKVIRTYEKEITVYDGIKTATFRISQFMPSQAEPHDPDLERFFMNTKYTQIHTA